MAVAHTKMAVARDPFKGHDLRQDSGGRWLRAAGPNCRAISRDFWTRLLASDRDGQKWMLGPDITRSP